MRLIVIKAHGPISDEDWLVQFIFLAKVMNYRTLASVSLGLWIATVAAAVFLFTHGQTASMADGRQAILLTEGERNLVLAEMRGMLESVQGVVEGIAQRDMKRVAVAARLSGTASTQQVPVSLMAKLPLAFKQMGQVTHRDFDEIALRAEGGEPEEMLLERLGERLKNCIACHATFRLPEAEKNLR